MQANCSVNSVNSVGVFTLYKYLCGSVQSVGEYPLPVCSVCSVKSVGDLSAESSVYSVNSVGDYLSRVNSVGGYRLQA